MAQVSGLLLVDKPVGPTSHDVVAAVRRAAGQKRVGHAGTLDPRAEGLLLVLLGSVTRLAEYLVGHDKRYEVEVLLGVETDSYDAEGRVTRRWDGPLPDDAAITSTVAGLVGEIWQTPPAYSAVKVGGQPLHRLARRGAAPTVPPRQVTIHCLRWRRLERERLVLAVHCSSGTYIRSLVHDLGVALGCGAHVAKLRRTRSGPFSVEQAESLPTALERLAARDTGTLLRASEALPMWPRVVFDAVAVARLRRGQPVSGPEPPVETPHLAAGPDGDVVAIVVGDPALGVWRPHKVLSQETVG